MTTVDQNSKHSLHMPQTSVIIFQICPSFSADVGAFFEEGMWLRYNFQAPAVTARDTGSRAENSADQQHLPPDLAQEQIHLSFSTTKAPCILLYVSSLTTDFLAVLIKPTGKGKCAQTSTFRR